MHEAGHSKPVPWDNPEGWGGEGGGRGFRMGEHMWEKRENAYFNVKENYEGRLTQRDTGGPNVCLCYVHPIPGDI